MNSLVQRIVFVLVFVLSSSIGYSQQGRLARADKAFDKYSFIDARAIYLKVIEEGYESAQVYEKLGDTYYFNSEYAEAAQWYGKLLSQYPDQTEPVYYYRAAQSLKSINKYGESDRFMEEYTSRGGNQALVDANYLEKIADNAWDFTIDKVGINTKGSDFGPSYYGDKIVFASANTVSEGVKNFAWTDQPFLDLYIADKDAEGNLSNATSLSGEVNSSYHESSAVFTKDGSTMYFTRNNFLNGKKGLDRGKKAKTIRLKLYKATREGDRWINVEELPFNSDSYSVAHPALSVDERRLYFSSDMEGSLGMSDLWYVTIEGDGSYGVPVNLGSSINTELRESFPYISEENRLYFSSDGRSGLGGYDIYTTKLTSEGNMVGDIINIGSPANSNMDDFGFIYKESQGRGYLASNRGGSGGSIGDDIYVLRDVVCEISIGGRITNQFGEVIANAEVTLLDADNAVIATTMADANGVYSFDELASCDTAYRIRVTKDRCESKEEISQTPDETTVVSVDVALTCDTCPINDLGCRLKLEPIYFDLDKYNIRPDAEIELAKILSAMREYPELKIHIESHTDSRAGDRYNEILSDNRAKSTLEWLVNNGIDRSRLTAKGYGEYQLVNECSNEVDCTEEEHQLNRRSMFIIRE